MANSITTLRLLLFVLVITASCYQIMTTITKRLENAFQELRKFRKHSVRRQNFKQERKIAYLLPNRSRIQPRYLIQDQGRGIFF